METGPRWVERDPRNLKIRKRGCRRRSKGVRLGGPSRWSKLLKNSSKRRARADQAMVERRPRGEDGKRFNATIVVVTTSYGVARSGKKSKRNFVLPREKSSPAPLRPYGRVAGMEPLDRQ